MTAGQNWILIGLTVGSLIVSGILIVACYMRAKKDNGSIGLTSRMGQGHWDFSQSFASNIALVGSGLTALLASRAFPTVTQILPLPAYAGLAIFFGVVVVIAPLIYNGTTKRVPVSPGDVDTADEYHGTVWGFLAASLITDWGFAGSLSTIFVVLLDIYDAGNLSVVPLVVLSVALFASLLFCVHYNWVKIDGTLTDQFDPDRVKARADRIAMMRADAVPPLDAPSADKPPPSPRWTLL